MLTYILIICISIYFIYQYVCLYIYNIYQYVFINISVHWRLGLKFSEKDRIFLPHALMIKFTTRLYIFFKCKRYYPSTRCDKCLSFTSDNQKYRVFFRAEIVVNKVWYNLLMVKNSEKLTLWRHGKAALSMILSNIYVRVFR